MSRLLRVSAFFVLIILCFLAFSHLALANSPMDGPGGPILVISNASDPYSSYYAEILRTEGLNEFAAMDISLVTPSILSNYDVVILAVNPLTSGQVSMVASWVSGGGNLIAMHPDKQLALLLGLTDASATLANGYLLINTASGPGVGLVNQTIQFHGVSDLYTLNSASSLATLYSDASTPTASPAVTLNSFGAGQAAAFTYDLARSMVWSRQGNPAWSGMERDGSPPIRSDDLFFGASVSDPESDWIDLNKVAIPQADEQQRLLANLIVQMNTRNKPLPRFWYFPRGAKAVVVMTGDDHGNGGTVGRFNTFLADSTPGCSVANWECVRGTSYTYPSTPMTDGQAAAFVAQGFEVGVHFTTDCADWTPSTLEAFFADQAISFATNFPSLPAPQTNRTHCIAWSDYDAEPQVELNHGIRFDTNYYYWPPSWVNDRPGMFTGSGMPMRFAKIDGTMIDVYQATTQMTDESGQSFPYTIDTLLDNAIGATGYYGAFTANMHNDSPESDGANAIVASAQTRGVPIVTSLQMLQWLDGRNGSSFGNFTWNGNSLSFSISLAANSNGAQAMLPNVSSVGLLTGITLNSTPVTYTTQTIKGVAYAVFTAAAGTYTATFAPDTSPPVISSISALANSSSTATVTWTTDELSSSVVNYGTTSSNLNQQANTPGLVTSHSVSLSGLTPNTTYYYQVTSTDAFNNTATAPASPATFETPAASLSDGSTSDFASGTGSCSAVPFISGGEVILTPTVDAEFNGSALPPDWSTNVWSSGGGISFGSGAVTIDGADIASNQSQAPGSSLDFVATFSGQPFQHVGFAADIAFDSPWIIFSTAQSGHALYARIFGNPDVLLPGNWLGSPHHFRIDWTANSVSFSIDGTVLSTQNVAVPNNLVLVASDLNPGGGSVSVNWMRLSPYATTCSFTSRVLDAGAPVFWSSMSWTADTPSGTSLAMSYRVGNTPSPDSSWTSFQSVAGSGGGLAGSSRYIQYAAALATTDTTRTPALQTVNISYGTGTPPPPVINAQSPSPGATNVPVGTTVSATFSNPMNPATITTASFRLRANGSPSDVPATVSYASGVATLVPMSNLASSTTYTVTVAGTVADMNGDQLGADVIWTFTTGVVTLTHTDTTVADFSAGSTSCSIVAHTGDGEVVLVPTIGEEFSSTTLPPNWTSTPWTGGTPVVSNGMLTVDGTLFAYNTYYSSGSSLEFVATFGADTSQHLGFGQALQSLSESWAMFSTFNSGNALYARTNNAGIVSDVQIPGNWIGTSHRYRIDWTATSVVFWIDGTMIHTEPVAISATMRPVVSDYNNNGIVLSVDWLLMTPYTSPCVFDSAVIDAGSAANWETLSWDAVVPAQSALALSYRTGNSNNPTDGTWTSFTPVANSGATLTGISRYIQYEANLSTTDTSRTPVLTDVTVAYILSSGGPQGVITAPAPGSTLNGSSVAFQWMAGSGSSAYWLDIGNVPGGNQYYQSGNLGNVLAAAVNGLPTDGSTVYVTLYSLMDEGGQWLSNAYAYAAYNNASLKGVITTPAPGATLSGSSVTFNWTTGTGATAYWLDAGSVPGGNQYYQSGNLGNVLTTTANGLPTDASTVYVTLYSLVGGQWLSNAYTYTAYSVSGAQGVITTPTPGSSLASSTVTFVWTAGTGSTAYWLDIGNVAGGNQYYQSGNLGNVLTTTANGLPSDGSTVYVTLYSLVGGQWLSNAYTYTAYSASGATGHLTTPQPGTTLPGPTVTFGWTAGTGSSAYWLDLGSTPGGNQYFQSGNLGNVLTVTANGLPTNGSTVYATLYSLVGGQWVANAYTYTAFSSNSGLGVITSPTPGSTLNGNQATFTWNAGTGATAYWLDIGNVAGGNQYYQSGNLGNVLTTTVYSLPADNSTIYVTLYSFVGGQWLSNAYTYVSGQ